MKRETLVELAEYVNTPVGQKIFSESMMPDIIEMVRVNLFRTLPPPSDELEIDEEEGNIEPAWPHLQIIYELFLRFIISPEVNGKVAKKFVDANFLRNWIELFDAEDPRERDYVKTILHRKCLLLFPLNHPSRHVRKIYVLPVQHPPNNLTSVLPFHL